MEPKNKSKIKTCKNLRFLTEVLSELKLTPETYGEYTSNPHSEAVQLRQNLTRDDMKVTRAYTILKNLGYNLEIKLTKKEEEIKNYTLSFTRKEDNTKSKSTELKNKNIAFLEEFMIKNNIGKTELARDIQVSPGAVFNWFKNDNISISYLYKIKEAYNIELEYIITPLEK